MDTKRIKDFQEKTLQETDFMAIQKSDGSITGKATVEEVASLVATVNIQNVVATTFTKDSASNVFIADFESSSNLDELYDGFTIKVNLSADTVIDGVSNPREYQKQANAKLRVATFDDKDIYSSCNSLFGGAFELIPRNALSWEAMEFVYDEGLDGFILYKYKPSGTVHRTLLPIATSGLTAGYLFIGEQEIDNYTEGEFGTAEKLIFEGKVNGDGVYGTSGIPLRSYGVDGITQSVGSSDGGFSFTVPVIHDEETNAFYHRITSKTGSWTSEEITTNEETIYYGANIVTDNSYAYQSVILGGSTTAQARFPAGYKIAHLYSL